MKFVTILVFSLLLCGLAFSQSIDPSNITPGTDITSEGYDFSALTPLVKGLIDGFRMMMLQVRFVRMLFENLGVEMGRIARNTTTMPSSGPPYPLPSKYGLFSREETASSSSEPSQPVEPSIGENIFGTRFQQIFDRWGENTAVAFRGLLSEVAHVYQDAVTTMVKQGEVSRNQVVAGYNTIRTAMTSISKMIQENFPTATSVASSISNISSAINQNVTNILSGMVPDGLPTGLPITLPTGLPSIPSIPGLPGLPSLPNLQDLIPTTPQTGSSQPSKKKH